MQEGHSDEVMTPSLTCITPTLPFLLYSLRGHGGWNCTWCRKQRESTEVVYCHLGHKIWALEWEESGRETWVGTVSCGQCLMRCFCQGKGYIPYSTVRAQLPTATSVEQRLFFAHTQYTASSTWLATGCICQLSSKRAEGARSNRTQVDSQG